MAAPLRVYCQADKRDYAEVEVHDRRKGLFALHVHRTDPAYQDWQMVVITREDLVKLASFAFRKENQ